jgi:NitT/TauT family transport system permease protein
VKHFFRTDARPSAVGTLMLSLLFFVLLLGGYFAGSHYRHLENPQDKVMPTLSEMLDGVKRSAFERDRNGELRLWVDTAASARRFGLAIGVLFLAMPLGVGMGLFPYVDALFHRFLVFFDKIPALSVLPILFIVLALASSRRLR